MNSRSVVTASFLIALSIILGAVAAHALEKKLSEDLLHNWEVAARYQMYGGLGLLAVGLLADKFKFSISVFAFLLVLGIILFSGSLYLYCFKGFYPFLAKAAMITPIGGVLMIVSWIVFAIQILRNRQ